MDPRLLPLLRSFYSLTPVHAINVPHGCFLSELNDFFVNQVLLDYHFLNYPPSREYQRRFWKWAIESLEQMSKGISAEEHDEEFEIDYRIYDHYIALIASSTSSTSLDTSRTQGIGLLADPPSQSYITYFWKSERTVFDTAADSLENISQRYKTATLLESRTTIESGTTGLRTWLASFVLAQYLIRNPELVASKRVLELGSGIGYLGIIVGTLQMNNFQLQDSSALWLTDVNLEVLSRCRDNINLPCNASSSHPSIAVLRLDWEESIDVQNKPSFSAIINNEIDPDLIIGADVIFDPSLINPLVETLAIALRGPRKTDADKFALIALTVRNEVTLKLFLHAMQGSSLKVEEIDLHFTETISSENIDGTSENVKLFRIIGG